MQAARRALLMHVFLAEFNVEGCRRGLLNLVVLVGPARRRNPGRQLRSPRRPLGSTSPRVGCAPGSRNAVFLAEFNVEGCRRGLLNLVVLVGPARRFDC